MRFFVLMVLCLGCMEVISQPRVPELLEELDQIIARRDSILYARLGHMENLKARFRQERSPAAAYVLCRGVYEDYKTLNYDSAFAYARKLQRLAHNLGDKHKIADARIKLGFVLVSSGLFNEALDTLRLIGARYLSDSLKVSYYFLRARTSYDLSDFNRDAFYSSRYTDEGNLYIDSALVWVKQGSVPYLHMSGLKLLHLRKMTEAREAFETMLAQPGLSDADFAVAASTLSFIYFYSDRIEKSKEMLIRAAIADIRSATKETLATLNLADMLYREGDIEHAYSYVKVAMEDANYYGARHRKIQVAAVFPIIEGKQLNLVESRRRVLLFYSTVITLLSLVTIGFSIIIYKQFKKLRAAKKAITQANDELTDANHRLKEANHIKEEYVWYYFAAVADHIAKLDALKKSLDMKLMTKKLDDLRFTVDSINIKREREDLYHNFDMVFLKIFPSFVKDFNALFKEEEAIVLKEGQLLNTELRIFALIRMGIHDHEKIARILDYSVTTIYTYKTRLRNKSIVPNEEFEKRIMAIRAI